MQEIAVRLDRLVKKFGNTVAVDHVSLEVISGEFITFLGPSGSGKTTTLMMIAGFEAPTSGNIYMGQESILSKPSFKRDMGVVFQHYSLFPHMTVFGNIAFPLRMRKLDERAIEKKVGDVLEVVRLPDFGQRYPSQLSGGQQQRVALARALVFNPPILLMDEPLGALDKNLRESMQLEIKDIQAKLRITTIYVTHDQSEALTMSDRIVVMNHGRIEQIGSPEDLYERPASRFVAEFVGETNLINGTVHEVRQGTFAVASRGGMQLKIPRYSEISKNQEILLAIRPERIAFFTNTNSEHDLNLLDGIVEGVVYVGEIRKYRVRVCEEVSLILKQTNSMGAQKFEKGDRVTIGWRADDARIV